MKKSLFAEKLEKSGVYMQPLLCVVETKLQSAFICQHRPLKPGETPKRRGQATVFEATGEVRLRLLSHPGRLPLAFSNCSKIHTGSLSSMMECALSWFKRNKD